MQTATSAGSWNPPDVREQSQDHPRLADKCRFKSLLQTVRLQECPGPMFRFGARNSGNVCDARILY
jgi:hypothetical protein